MARHNGVSRFSPRMLNRAVAVLGVLIALCHLIFPLFPAGVFMGRRAFHVFSLLVLWFLRRAGDGLATGTRLAAPSNLFLALFTLGCGIYAWAGVQPRALLEKSLEGLSALDGTMSLALLFLAALAVAQTLGQRTLLVLFCAVCLFPLLRVWPGLPLFPNWPYVSAPFPGARGLAGIAACLAWTPQGVLGGPVGASAGCVFLCALFAALRERMASGGAPENALRTQGGRVPALVLICLVAAGLPAERVAFAAVAALIALKSGSMLIREGRAPWREIALATGDTARIVTPIMAACAAAGAVLGVAYTAGLIERAQEFAPGLSALWNERLFALPCLFWLLIRSGGGAGA